METFVVANLRRTNRARVNGRLHAYPVRDWLDRAVDTLDPAFDETAEQTGFVARREDDFPAITREQLIQDLHRIARIATDQAPAEYGFVVRTTTRGLAADQVGFVFYKVPRSEARGTDAVRAPRIELAPQHPQQQAYGAPATTAPNAPNPAAAPQPVPAPQPISTTEAPAWCNGGGTVGHHRWGSPPPGVSTCVCTASPSPEATAPVPAAAFPPPPPFIVNGPAS